MKLQVWGLQKETLAQVFCCKFWEIFKNTLFYRTPLVATSVFHLLIVAIFHFILKQIWNEFKIVRRFLEQTEAKL